MAAKGQPDVAQHAGAVRGGKVRRQATDGRPRLDSCHGLIVPGLTQRLFRMGRKGGGGGAGGPREGR